MPSCDWSAKYYRVSAVHQQIVVFTSGVHFSKHLGSPHQPGSQTLTPTVGFTISLREFNSCKTKKKLIAHDVTLCRFIRKSQNFEGNLIWKISSWRLFLFNVFLMFWPESQISSHTLIIKRFNYLVWQKNSL